MTKILPSITTTSVFGRDWRKQFEEIKKINLEEVAFFPTCLKEKKIRQEAYKLLEDSPIESIPFVHLREDMDIEEIEYFINKWGTKVFNNHSKKEHQPKYDLSKYKKIIYIENHPPHYVKIETHAEREEKLIKEYGGICLDVAHLESERLEKSEHYEVFIEFLKKYKCGCWHASAIYPKKEHDPSEDVMRFDHHLYKNLSELDYLKRYQEFLPEFVALEVENTLSEQLEAKKYIEKIFNIN